MLAVLWFFCFATPLQAILIPSSCSSDSSCSSQIIQAISTCGSGPCTISFGSGVYSISAPVFSTVFRVTGANQLRFVGAGSDKTILEMADIYSLFLVENSNNVAFQGFTVTMKRLPYTTGISISPTQLTVDTRLYPVDQQTYPWLSTCQALNEITLEGLYQGIDDYFLTDPHNVTFIANGELMEVSGMTLPVGRTFIVRHQVYVYNTFSILNVDGVSFNDITIKATAGMGLFTSFCSSVEVDSFRITPMSTPSGTSYPMSITADGMHFSNTVGYIHVQNCTIEGQGDDCLNVATDMTRLTKINSNTEIVLQAFGGGSLPIKKGHWVTIVDGENLSPKQNVQVLNVVRDVVTLANPMASSVKLWDVVYDVSSVASPVLIRYNVFRRNRARGVLAKGYNMVIEDNLFIDNSGPALLFQTDACYFMEGPPLINATVRNNQIQNSNYNQGPAAEEGAITLEAYVAFFKNGEPSKSCGDAQSVVNYNITVASNTLTLGQPDNTQLAIQISSTNYLNIVDNQIWRKGALPSKEISTAYCGSVVENGNKCNGAAC